MANKWKLKKNLKNFIWIFSMLYKAKLLLFVLSSPMLNKCLFCLHFLNFQKKKILKIQKPVNWWLYFWRKDLDWMSNASSPRPGANSQSYTKFKDKIWRNNFQFFVSFASWISCNSCFRNSQSNGPSPSAQSQPVRYQPYPLRVHNWKN